jgi:hypothetical protein
MRRFILITALVLASATAQAAPSSRGLTMASNDESTSERIETVKPAEAAKPEATAPEAAKPETSRPKVAKADGSRSAPKAHGKRYDNYAGDEARARSIAARYGISW